MDWLNDSDWNNNAAFESADGSRVSIEAHRRGYADDVSVESVPGPKGNELVVLFRAEAGYTGAAVRLKDLLVATMRHQPELWQEVLDLQAAENVAAVEEDVPSATSGFYHS